ncbi:DNA-binding response regulator [Cohnella sp. CIP 111063]|uniref:response regulator transcription factor n=1 Tax=unclassified Cohnella TaxID=2636738 RepID=UPI000B8BE5B1|nr:MULTISPECIES: response regulator [unclassified Cohnella]OXS55603.1 DNA-binding response regulator [Cohnella sp. CIP 111063]PRX66448.1 AraC family two component transcriptional regulator [Cohnella sp. SGD-V74]
MYKVLLVEDETVIRQGLRELIGRSTGHFEVTGEAASGVEALDYLKCELPDLLITDIRMREMDGLTMVAQVREMYPSLPVVIISGYGEFEYAKKAISYGVCSYLLKPIERLELVAALDKIKLALDRERGISVPPQPGTERSEAPAPGGDARKIIRDVKEYVKLHIDGDLRLQTVAGNVHLNATYLSQLFKAETGTNYSEYVSEARMERAKWLLAHTRLKIYDVARLSGHQSPKHFMLVFKQQVGATAGEYRDRYGQPGPDGTIDDKA